MAGLLAVSVLLTSCGSDSDSGGGSPAAGFSGVLEGAVAEDGQLTAFAYATPAWLDDEGAPVDLDEQPQTASDLGYGTFSVSRGWWRYSLNNAAPAVQSLDAAETVEDTFPLTASDGSVRTVTISIDGAEDAPVIVGDETGLAAKGRWPSIEGRLSIRDADSNDNPIGFGDVSGVPGSAGLGTFGTKGRAWTYDLDVEHPALDDLATGESLVDSHVFEANDGSRFEVVVSVYSIPAPNVVVVMADDLGFADVGFNGSKQIPTPNIDSIAANGIHFVQGTTSHAACSPTRAGFLTGRYQQRFGYVYNPAYKPYDPVQGLPLDEVLLSDVLADAGYVTGLIGKWHLGAAPHFHPNERGFEYFYGFVGGNHEYWRSEKNLSRSTVPLMRNQTSLASHPGYLTDVFSGEAVSFIERHTLAPFFLFLSYNAPHSPLEAPLEYRQCYQHIKNKNRRLYSAMVSALDDGVGEVLAALREQELMESTLIFFLGDNGGNTENGAKNRFRGKKGSNFDGGFRVPFALQWDGTVPEGVRYEHQVSSLDIFPTVVAAAGAAIPEDTAYDGVDLLPFVQSDRAEAPHGQLFWRRGAVDSPSYAVREERLKLISQKDGEVLLFDLVEDPLESKDISNKQPDEVRRLQDAYALWNSEMTAPLALPDPREE